MSKKYEELNEAKKKRFEGRKIEQIQDDVKYENPNVQTMAQSLHSLQVDQICVKSLDDITTTKPTTTTNTTTPDLTGIDPLIGDADPFTCSPDTPFIEDQSDGAREWLRTRVSDWPRSMDGQQVVDRSR